MKRYIKSAIKDILQEHWTIKQQIADDPNTDPRVLTHLAQDSSRWTREHVARNPNTPIDVLQQLAADPYYDVRRSIQFNDSAPRELKANIDAKLDDYSGIAEILISGIDYPLDNAIKDYIHDIVDNFIPSGCSVYSESYVLEEDAPEYFNYYLQCGPIDERQASDLADAIYITLYNNHYHADDCRFEMLLK